MSISVDWLKEMAGMFDSNPDPLLNVDQLKSETPYPTCDNQLAQIDCRLADCRFNYSGNCTNVSPAITLNLSGEFTCWSKEQVIIVEEKEEKMLFLVCQKQQGEVYK